MSPDATFTPIHFIDEEIQVQFDEAPRFEKRPGCPVRFVWRGETLRIVESLGEWVNYARKGRMAENMRPAHTTVASARGSWGVGRFTFRVRVESGQIFDICYDRAPKHAADRKGNWVLYRELAPAAEGDEA